MDLIVARPEGLYCPAGDFYIDPWRPVARAVITHAHADHARRGHGHYLAAAPAEGVLRARLGAELPLQCLAYGERIEHRGVTLSLHPAGHVLGSAQVRLAHRGQVWVASGDYKTAADPTCAPFEPVRCDTFITESTFGLPIYRWEDEATLMAQVNQWWAANAAAGRSSVLYCYAFGKAQRLLAGVDPSIGPLVAHGAIPPLNAAYRAAGVALPETQAVQDVAAADLKRALVLAPPSAAGSPWLRRFGDADEALASGWMRVRGQRRRRGLDRGFVLSDHADWPGLLAAIEATGAARIIVTHGAAAPLVRWLGQHRGLQAEVFHTEYGDEDGSAEPAATAPASASGGGPGEVSGEVP